MFQYIFYDRLRRDLRPVHITTAQFRKERLSNAIDVPINAIVKLFSKNQYARRMERKGIDEWLKKNDQMWDEFRFYNVSIEKLK